jgi:hypothetical protein
MTGPKVRKFTDFIGTPFQSSVLPVIPTGPNIKYSPNCGIDPERIGKIPGWKGREGWSGFAQWQKNYTTEAQLRAWQRWYDDDKIDPIIAFLGRLLPAIDMDFDDKSVVKRAIEIAFKMLGETCIRARPNSAKCLLPYRLDQHKSFEVVKQRILFETQSTGRGAFEILGTRQHYLTYGRHPSGVDYEWMLDLDPFTIGWDNIPLVSFDQLLDYLNALREEFTGPDWGFALVKGGGLDAARMTLSDSKRYEVGPNHPELCPDLDMLKDVLTNYLPADHHEFPTHDDWVRPVIAIVTACGKDESFYPFFVDWCSAWPENIEEGEGYIRGKWESVRESSIGWGYLCHIAHDYGYVGDAQLMFDDLGALEDDLSTSSPEPLTQPDRHRGPIPKPLPADFDVRKLPQRQFVLGHRFMAGAVTVGVAAPGTGKSYLSILSALAIATGREFTGEPVHRQGPVWVHNNEEDIEELYRRIGGILQFNGVHLASVRENIFVTSGLAEPLIVAFKDKDIVKRTRAVVDVIRSIKKMGIVHMVIDPFVSTHTGVSENSNEEIEQVAEALRQIAYETGCSIDLVHHSLKTHSKNTEVHAGDMNAARGASSLIAAARSVYTLSTMSEKTANELGLHPAEATRLVRLDHGKGNYAARDADVRWFELMSFDIGNGDAGTDDFRARGDTIAVPLPWQSPSAGSVGTTANARDIERREQLERVRTIVAKTMSSDRCRMTAVLSAIEKEFLVKQRAARNLVTKAIPEGEEVLTEINGTTYSLITERAGRSAPNPIFIVRKLLSTRAQAA